MKEIYIPIFLLLFSTSLLLFLTPKYLCIQAYEDARAIEKIVEGEKGSIFHTAVANIYYLISGGKRDKELLLNLLLFLPSLILIFTTLIFYFGIRAIFSPIIGLISAILLLSSPLLLEKILPGNFYEIAFTLLLFISGISFFLLSSIHKNYIFSALSGILFGSSLTLESGLPLFALFVFAALLQSIYSRSYSYILISLLFSAPFFYFAKYENIFIKADLFTFINNVYFLLPLALLSIPFLGRDIIKKKGKFEVFFLAILFLSILIGLFNPYLGISGLVFASGVALNEILNMQKDEKMGVYLLSAAIFLISFAILMNYLELLRVLIFSLVVSVGAFSIRKLYKEEKLANLISFSIFFLLALTSLNVGVLTSQYPRDIMDEEWSEALKWIKENIPKDSVVIGKGMEYPIEFISERKSASFPRLTDFLLSNISTDILRQENITHIIFDGYLFDEIEELKNESGRKNIGIDSFKFFGYAYDEKKNLYARFGSPTGKILMINADKISGRLMTELDVYIDGRRVSFKRLLKIGGECDCVSDLITLKCQRTCRYIYPYENYKINLFNAFFSDIKGLKIIYNQGRMRIFEVE